MEISPKAVAELAEGYTAAWCARSADGVASFFTPDADVIINRGDPWVGHRGITEMASGFFADVPDLTLISDDVRCAGNHAINVWTFTGHHVETGNPISVPGWEEWTLSREVKIAASRGWYDADDYALQIAGNA